MNCLVGSFSALSIYYVLCRTRRGKNLEVCFLSPVMELLACVSRDVISMHKVTKANNCKPAFLLPSTTLIYKEKDQTRYCMLFIAKLI